MFRLLGNKVELVRYSDLGGVFIAISGSRVPAVLEKHHMRR